MSTFDHLNAKYDLGLDPSTFASQATYDKLAELFDRIIESNAKAPTPAVTTEHKDAVRQRWAKLADASYSDEFRTSLEEAINYDTYDAQTGAIPNLLAWEHNLTEVLRKVKEMLAFEIRALAPAPVQRSITALPKADALMVQDVLSQLMKLHEMTGGAIFTAQLDKAGAPRTFTMPRGKFRWAEEDDTPTKRPTFSRVLTVTVTDPDGIVLYEETNADLAQACKLVAPGFTDEDLRNEVNIFDAGWAFTHPDTDRTITGDRN